jgi:hypothetical protein
MLPRYDKRTISANSVRNAQSDKLPSLRFVALFLGQLDEFGFVQDHRDCAPFEERDNFATQ